jgi:uncharacterized protein
LTPIGLHEVLSVGWSNPTPWDTRRECSEDELAARIDTSATVLEDENAIFNVYLPPYSTGLDDAPKLGKDGVPSGNESAPVGSKAVRETILAHQPFLSIHGHIYESRVVQKLERPVDIRPGQCLRRRDAAGRRRGPPSR